MSRTLRSRNGIGAGALAALCLAALSASAQERPVVTRQGNGDTVKINVSGRVEMDYVQRDAALMILPGMGAFAPDNNGVNTVEGEIAIRFDAELTEKISVVVELGRLRTDSIFGVQPFSGDNGFVFDTLALREAHMKVMDFLSPGLSAKMGISDWSFDVRGRGASLWNPHYAQSITRNIFNGQDAVTAMDGRYGIGSATELEPLGIHLSYTSGAITVDLAALPAVLEGGQASTGDEALYALDVWYNLDEQVGKGSRIGALLALHNLPDVGFGGTGSHSRMITFGAGANLVFSQLEVFAEGYLQRGAINRDGADDEIDAKGHAFVIGGRYNVSAESATWLEVSFSILSGDDDGTDDEMENFVSYESVNDFLIIEDMYFGLDVDTNLTAIKIMGGTAFGMAGGKNNLELMLGVGFFTATEDVLGLTGEEDAFGTEIDVKAKYHLNKQAALTLNFGILTGSDILEDMGGGSAVDAADDSTWLASLGFDVRY